MSFALTVAVGLALSVVIGAAAYWRGALTRSGVLGAVVIGAAIFGVGGLVPGILLVAFFLTSSFLSRYQARAKAEVEANFQKGARRDLGQALANGGLAAACAVALGLAGQNNADAHLRAVLFAGVVGALATATADTWATEVGVLSEVPPRMITTGRPAPPGTSGAVTPMGTLTALAGGLFIGWLAFIGLEAALYVSPMLGLNLAGAIPAGAGSGARAFYLVIGSIAGLGGALFDSVLGATVQGIYVCEYDEQLTERKVHSCGRTTRLVRGWAWLDNDRVNLLATFMGAILAGLLAINFL